MNVKSGTMYPILCRLLENGNVSSYEETVNKKIRLYYYLETSSLVRLNNLIKEYRELVDRIENVINYCTETRL